MHITYYNIGRGIYSVNQENSYNKKEINQGYPNAMILMSDEKKAKDYCRKKNK